MRGQAGDARAQRVEGRERQALAGRRERSRRQAQDRARRQEPGEPGPGLGAGQRGPLPLRLRDRGRQRQVSRDAPRHTRVLAIDPVLEGRPGLERLQHALRARPDRQPGRGQHLLAHVLHQLREPAHHRLERGRGLVVREAERVGGHHEAGRQLRGGGLAQQHLRDARERGRVAREPPGGVGARRLPHHAGQIEPAVGRPDAVEAAEARRHAHRSAGVGAERGVAQPLGHRRGRARRGAAGHAVGRLRVERGAVEGILAEDAERDLVGDGLADQARAGVEQALHGPGVARRDGMRPAPVRVAAAGRVAGHVEQILGRERQAGERAARSAGDTQHRAGHEGTGHVERSPDGDHAAPTGGAASRAARATRSRA